jgi:glycosyltransferase involved in cell wall biosynthesis
VFRGAELVTDALSSIAAQTFRDLRVIVSVDGGDERSAIACRPFERDARFRVVVQEQRLGWGDNINWLVHRSETEFFAYVAQDDRIHPTYYEALLKCADRNPEVTVVYSDVELFGRADGVVGQPEIDGGPVDRMIAAINGGFWLPFLGVRRAALATKVDKLLVDEADSTLEDVIWVLKALQVGTMRRVAEPLYFKRVHGDMVTMGTRRWSPDHTRRVWIDAWARVLAAALQSAVDREDTRRMLVAVLQRCCVCAPDMDWFYELARLTRAERRELASDFLAHAGRRASVVVASKTGEAWDAVRRWALRELEAVLGYWGPSAADEAVRPAPPRTRLHLDKDIAASGWHRREHHPRYGSFRWSGPATISEIPVNVLLDAEYRVRIHIIFIMLGVLAKKIGLREDGKALPTRIRRMDDETFILEAIVRPGRAGATRPREMRLSLSVDATFRPADVGVSGDQRLLGCAVNWIEIEPWKAGLAFPFPPCRAGRPRMLAWLIRPARGRGGGRGTGCPSSAPDGRESNSTATPLDVGREARHPGRGRAAPRRARSSLRARPASR